MNKRSVDEIYAANNAIREKLKDAVSSLTPEQTSHLPEGEKWSIANIVEHLSMVEESMTRVCAKLLRKAQAAEQKGDGTIAISNTFAEKGNEIARIKAEAPEIVQPTCEKTMAESLEALSDNRKKLDELKPMFESWNSSDHRFPHPLFGDLSAGEWLTLIGGHEARHIRQIRKMIGKF